jgi:hypothetical protein
VWGIAAPPRRDASAGHFLKTKPIPRKLKNDAIIEALFEIRFDMESVPELLYGRLADHSGWRSLEQRRLPAYDIPAPMRQVDENLRYQPVFELNDSARNSSIRIGPQVLSFHQRQPYGSSSTTEWRAGHLNLRGRLAQTSILDGGFLTNRYWRGPPISRLSGVSTCDTSRKSVIENIRSTGLGEATLSRGSWLI